MTDSQKRALDQKTFTVPVSVYFGPMKVSLSVVPSDNRTSGFMWLCSTSGRASPAEKMTALLSALHGVGDPTTDNHTKNPVGATYVMRDLTPGEVMAGGENLQKMKAAIEKILKG